MLRIWKNNKHSALPTRKINYNKVSKVEADVITNAYMHSLYWSRNHIFIFITSIEQHVLFRNGGNTGLRNFSLKRPTIQLENHLEMKINAQLQSAVSQKHFLTF